MGGVGWDGGGLGVPIQSVFAKRLRRTHFALSGVAWLRHAKPRKGEAWCPWPTIA